jgi:hypothetical protein
MKDVNCRNWSHKFPSGRSKGQQLCSEGTKLTEAHFLSRFHPRMGAAHFYFIKDPELRSRETQEGEGDRSAGLAV